LAKLRLAYWHAVAGGRKEALRIVSEVEQLSKTRYVSPTGLAIIFAALDERDKAFAWLDKAVELQTPLEGLKVNPEWDPLRSDPRFQDLLRRMNFPP